MHTEKTTKLLNELTEAMWGWYQHNSVKDNNPKKWRVCVWLTPGDIPVIHWGEARLGAVHLNKTGVPAIELDPQLVAGVECGVIPYRSIRRISVMLRSNTVLLDA